MIDGIYAAASGGYKQERSLEVIANNLANMNTAGFKRDTLAFKELLPPFSDSNQSTPTSPGSVGGAAKRDISYTGIVEFSTDFSQGSMIDTGNPLDVALDGEGFFAIQTKDGVRYTRQGNFRLNSERVLVTQDNEPVLGTGGPITIQGSGTIITFDTAGKISVGDGLANQAVGDLRIVNFDDPGKLVKTGKGFFMVSGENVQEKAADNVSVRQGVIESSNVSSVKEMTKMIEVMRIYESYQKIIQTIDAANSKAATEIGRLG